MKEMTKRRIMIATYHTHKLLSILVKVAIIVFLLWFTFSVFEVWMYNATLFDDNPYKYNNINLFELLMDM